MVRSSLLRLYLTNGVLSGAAMMLIILCGACSNDSTTPSKAGTFMGDTKTVGDGNAKCWVQWDDNGNPVSMGLTLSEQALKNLPDTGLGTEYVLMLPTQAAATGINHIGLDWNPKGHDPSGIYDLPHFDIHFYYITVDERMTIPFAKETLLPASKYLPANHITDSTSIPMMGVHFIDAASGEFHGHSFDKTFIYGFSKDKFVFLEPMITKAYLESKPLATTVIPQPAEWQTSNRYYPQNYTVKYDANAKEYIISLGGFVKK